ncbi:LysR family transcriptional regulator [Thalassobius vesicularis]|uniref:LysR family transcriptional regulator n=1 Tax=Thalassobius vesicularis TaxID=1294297 RepID=A0A4S3M4V0_9RHOB|nr:LysR family transcriptional regulator [Thalassobius vesicularis]THD71548.1 LysR family transcriptional regulator [Thalassobius vesicularis]
MAFTLRQLQFFVAAAEHGSVLAASKALSISQSSVTEAIKALELDLGVTLFERRARGMEITVAGHQFLRHARKIRDDVSDARRAFMVPSEARKGEIKLGVTSLVAGYGLSDALGRFKRTFPGVQLEAIEDTGEYLEHLLIGGEIDVAFLIVSNLHNRAAFQVESIAASAMRLWLPLGHPLATQEAVSLEDVAKEPLIMLSVEEIEASTQTLLASLGTRPKVAFRTRSVEAVRALVATGMGVAILPDLIYRPWSLEGDRIEIRDVSGDLPTVQVGMAWRRGAPLSDNARDFIRLARSSFQGTT